MGCVKLHILDEQYKNTELKVSYINKELTLNNSAVKERSDLFNAKELDTETGLYYYGARYYDPRTNLWLSVDPLWVKYPGISPYAYCSNNPIRYIDPDGRQQRKTNYTPDPANSGAGGLWGQAETQFLKNAGNAVDNFMFGSAKDTRKDGITLTRDGGTGVNQDNTRLKEGGTTSSVNVDKMTELSPYITPVTLNFIIKLAKLSNNGSTMIQELVDPSKGGTTVPYAPQEQVQDQGQPQQVGVPYALPAPGQTQQAPNTGQEGHVSVAPTGNQNNEAQQGYTSYESFDGSMRTWGTLNSNGDTATKFTGTIEFLPAPE